MRHPLLIAGACVIAVELILTNTMSAQAPEKAVPAYVDLALMAYAGGDVLDMVSTGSGLARGAREANPFLHPFEDHPVVFGTANAVMHSATTYILWKMAKHHPKRAAVISIALTSIEISVAKHNFAIAANRH